MLVAVFLPWFHYEYVLVDKTTTLESYNALGITTLWGIFGLVVAIIAAYGILYKQYAYALWAGILAVIFGCLGTGTLVDVEIDEAKAVILKEAFEEKVLSGESVPVSHVGANLFMIAGAFVAALSLVQLLKREEEAKENCLAKVALVVSAVIAAVICIDAVLVTPTIFSTLATKMLAWNLPLIAVLLVGIAYFKGESKNINLISAALLVIAFFFTNPVSISTKYGCQVKDIKHNIVEYHKLSVNESVINADKGNKKILEAEKKASTKAGEAKKAVQSVNDHAIQKAK
jgi:MFS family permease